VRQVGSKSTSLVNPSRDRDHNRSVQRAPSARDVRSVSAAASVSVALEFAGATPAATDLAATAFYQIEIVQGKLSQRL